MLRIKYIFYFLIVIGMLSCKAAKVDQAFSNISADAQTVKGDLVIRSTKAISDCVTNCQSRVLNKFLYQGFEGTALWRPQEMKKDLSDKELINKLYNNIYITNLSNNSGKTCRCSFQLNVASTRKILEDEGYIPAFGY